MQRPPQQRVLLVLSLFVLFFWTSQWYFVPFSSFSIPPHISAAIPRCQSINITPAPPSNFHQRSQSDRYVPGTNPTLLTNAKIWTGNKNGTEVIHGDILLDKGMIKSIGNLHPASWKPYKNDFLIINLNGSWVTPGIVDMHSHIGDGSAPDLVGSSDTNSLDGPILPWLRALDGLNTHDDSYQLSISGGVTTALVLPGSANAIGGQGFTIKLRSTAERTSTSLLLEAPYHINTSFPDPGLPPRWRQLKQACGENPSAVYDGTRMDTIWAFRKAGVFIFSIHSYNTANHIKQKQDAYCSKALSGQWNTLKEFPEDLQWEALVDVLRGKVKVHTHCYEAVDLDGLVRLSNEFKFSIAAFHHAHETYLVPDLLKQAYGELDLCCLPPAVALFATNARYKREAYRGSEFAPRVLAEHGIRVAMKSDHSVLNSRYLLYEAQQAHFYGLPNALASVTTTPAEVLGMSHRIGYLNEGWDADLVVWDSHPMALGATPKQVFIDGIAQLHSVHVSHKPQSFQSSPRVPNFDKEAADAVKYEGLPPLYPKKATSVVLFTNVKTVYIPASRDVQQIFSAESNDLGVVFVHNGTIICFGLQPSCLTTATSTDAEVVDLRGGSISPGLVSFGSSLGLEEINQESSTNDGAVYDPLIKAVPNILGGDKAMVRAVDGLQYATRDALLAYRAGVTTGITAPTHKRFYGGLSTSFSLGATHKLEYGAIIQDVAGLHVSVKHFGRTPSISTQIATLRRLLLERGEGLTGKWFKEVTEGRIPLVVEAHSADIIATLIMLKKQVEDQKGQIIKLTITGASEAHLLAKELAAENVGVIVNPSRPFPAKWESRRICPGPPLTKDSAISKLIMHNVTVGIGIEEIWSARNTRFDIAWAALEADGKISKVQALALGSTNIEVLLGAEKVANMVDLVATEGGDLMDMESKVVGIISSHRRLVDLF